MRNTLLYGILGTIGVLTAGCGHDCQDTCRHVYDKSECGVVIPGAQSEDLIRTCVRECETAMGKNGDLGDYTPYSHSASFENLILQNEKQAALWIDCVWDAAPDEGSSPGCQDLDPATGICAPI